MDTVRDLQQPVLIKHINLRSYHRIFVISDLHAQPQRFQSLLDRIHFDATQDALVIVGDLIEKGPDSLGLVRMVMSLSKYPSVFVSGGNCDDLVHYFGRPGLINYLQRVRRSIFHELANIHQIKLEQPDDMISLLHELDHEEQRLLDYLADLPDILVSEDYLFVHAGLRADIPLASHKRSDALDMERFYDQPYVSEKLLFVGHMPVTNYQRPGIDFRPIIDLERNIISMDGGNSVKADGQLNMIEIQNNQIRFWEVHDPRPIRFLDRQEASTSSFIKIDWFHRAIQIIRREGDMTLCYHPDSNATIWVPTCYIDDQEVMEDMTDYQIAISPGSFGDLVLATSRGSLVRVHHGLVGWYYGRYQILL